MGRAAKKSRRLGSLTHQVSKLNACMYAEQCEFVIEKVEYEKDKVIVSRPFDANKLSHSLWAKADRIIKNIEVIKEKEPEPKSEPKPKCKLVYSCPYYPYPCP